MSRNVTILQNVTKEENVTTEVTCPSLEERNVTIQVPLHATPSPHNAEPQTPNPQTPNPRPHTLNTKPQTPDPNSSTPKPKPHTPHPTTLTPHPKPQTPNPKPKPNVQVENYTTRLVYLPVVVNTSETVEVSPGKFANVSCSHVNPKPNPYTLNYKPSTKYQP